MNFKLKFLQLQNPPGILKLADGKVKRRRSNEESG
jgi:hypothetical protein